MREKQGFGLIVRRSKKLSLGVRVTAFAWLKSIACVSTFSGKSKGFPFYANQRANTTATATAPTAATDPARPNRFTRSPNRSNRQRGASCRYEMALRHSQSHGAAKQRLPSSGFDTSYLDFVSNRYLRSITLAIPAAFDSKGVWK